MITISSHPRECPHALVYTVTAIAFRRYARRYTGLMFTLDQLPSSIEDRGQADHVTTNTRWTPSLLLASAEPRLASAQPMTL